MRIYVKVYERGHKRPVLEFQALTPDDAIRELSLFVQRRFPKLYEEMFMPKHDFEEVIE